MTDLTHGPVTAAKTPLWELLRRIPKDATLQWAVPEESRELWQLGSASAPVGLLAHEAADALEARAFTPPEGLEVVAWFRASDKKPEPGTKFVGLYDDGSGAWLGFAHDDGFMDSDGDDHENMPGTEWWAYAPSGLVLVCEGHPVEGCEMRLPEHICPPLVLKSAADARLAELQAEIERLRGLLEEAREGLNSCSHALQRLHTDIEALMADSSGVVGLHQNGEVATWEELGEGGRFSDWLGDPLWAARNTWSDARTTLTKIGEPR